MTRVTYIIIDKSHKHSAEKIASLRWNIVYDKYTNVKI